MLLVFLVFFLAIGLAILFTKPLIWLFRFFKLGQSIREEGPQNHFSKAGTPNMGGLALLTTVLILNFVFINLDFKQPFLFLLFLIMGFALIGFLDDLLKLIKRQNLGLSAYDKFLLQFFIAFLFVAYLIFTKQIAIPLGLVRSICLYSAFLYVPFGTLVIVSSANAANLSDGLDGLLAGCLAIIFFGFIFISLDQRNIEAAIFSAACSGVLIGFLKYNYNPAKIFMGDIGSMGFGAALGGLTILLHKELLLILMAAPLVIETLSVIVQVASFKLTGKRILKMSPLHHHFELSGMPEKQVVFGFWLFTLLTTTLAIIINGNI